MHLKLPAPQIHDHPPPPTSRYFIVFLLLDVLSLIGSYLIDQMSHPLPPCPLLRPGG